MHELRKDFETQSDEERRVHEVKLRELYEQMELQRRTELQSTEERKNEQITTLTRNHEKAFREIKNYYNDITVNNLTLISTLKVGCVVYSLNGMFLPRNKSKNFGKRNHGLIEITQSYRREIVS